MTTESISAVLGGTKVLKRAVTSDLELSEVTRSGLPISILGRLAADLAMDRRTLAHLLGISDRTLSRRLAGKANLSSEESDRAVRVARAIAQATDTLGTTEKAAGWLQTANRALEGQIPLLLLDTDSGARAVETILLRIEYGVYS